MNWHQPYSKLIKYFIFLDTIVLITAILPLGSNIFLNNIFLFVNLFTIFFIWHMKWKYKYWDEIIKYRLYFMLLFVVPVLVNTFLTSILGISEQFIATYKIEQIVYFISKMILYARTYKILKANPKLDVGIFEDK